MRPRLSGHAAAPIVIRGGVVGDAFAPAAQARLLTRNARGIAAGRSAAHHNRQGRRPRTLLARHGAAPRPEPAASAPKPGMIPVAKSRCTIRLDAVAIDAVFKNATAATTNPPWGRSSRRSAGLWSWHQWAMGFIDEQTSWRRRGLYPDRAGRRRCCVGGRRSRLLRGAHFRAGSPGKRRLSARHSAGQMVRQDRANWHKFGNGDPEDQDDPWFTTNAKRERLQRMLDQGGAMNSGNPPRHRQRRAADRGRGLPQQRARAHCGVTILPSPRSRGGRWPKAG